MHFLNESLQSILLAIHRGHLKRRLVIHASRHVGGDICSKRLIYGSMAAERAERMKQQRGIAPPLLCDLSLWVSFGLSL
jgi:hypothetical protein